MAKRFSLWVAIAMVLGVVAGSLCHQWISDAAIRGDVGGYFALVTESFLRLIKMIIAPLVFATLTSGIARMGDAGMLGRVGVRAMLWFAIASAISLVLGVVMVNLIAPGKALSLSVPAVGVSSGVKASALTLKDFLTHLVPRSIVEAMANNEILQIVIFSGFFGIGLANLGDRAGLVTSFIEQVAHVMLKVTGYVMLVAPVAVFAAITSTVMSEGLGILWTYGRFLGGFFLALALLWVALILMGFAVLGRRVWRLLPAIREPVLLAFSTASSEAAYPKTLQQLERFGVSERIASFVLPLGYSFNLVGSTMYCTFATVFIAQAYGIELSVGQQLSMMLLLMVTSKGMAGVPRASLVVIAATLTHFGIPEAGLLLVIAVDHLLDMGRSATNVLGNSIATGVVAVWEGELRPERLPDQAAASSGSLP
jgi:Na+/H+-dicarboxylate symporter